MVKLKNLEAGGLLAIPTKIRLLNWLPLWRQGCWGQGGCNAFLVRVFGTFQISYHVSDLLKTINLIFKSIRLWKTTWFQQDSGSQMRNTTHTKRVWEVLRPWPFWLIFLLQRTDSQGQGRGSWSLCPIYTPQGHILVSLLHQGPWQNLGSSNTVKDSPIHSVGPRHGMLGF